MTQQITKVGGTRNVRTMLNNEQIYSSLQAIAGRTLNVDNIREQAVMAVANNPDLVKCDSLSFLAALRHVTQIQLPFAGPRAMAHLIPFGTKVGLIIGYRGLCVLARRSGQVTAIWAHCMREHDTFEVHYGTQQQIIHEPSLSENRGKIRAAYAMAKLRDGTVQFEVMTVDEIEAIRKRSKMANRDAWKNHYPEMAKKTVIRRLTKFLPCSADIQLATKLEDAGQQASEREIIESINVPDDDGEQETEQDAEIRQRQRQMLSYFAEMGVQKQQILDLLGLAKVEDVTPEHLSTLKDLAAKIKQGTLSAESMFPQQPRQQADVTEHRDEEKRKVLNDLWTALNQKFPDNTENAKEDGLQLLQRVFGTGDIDKVGELPTSVLRAGVEEIQSPNPDE